MMSEDLTGVWRGLEDAAVGDGVVYRRLHADSGHDLRALLDRDSGARSLVFERAWRPVDRLPALVQSRAVSVTTVRSSDARRMRFSVTLVDDSFRDVFSVMTEDLAASIAATADDISATGTLCSRLEHWRELLRELDGEGLSTTYRRGLFGELHVLAETILGPVDPRVALSGWTGPRRANQDFQYPGLAIEVKTTSGQQPQALVVTNERELDDTGVGSLYLVHVSIDERLGGDGKSLNSVVDRITVLLGDDVVAMGGFRAGLGLYGYQDGHRDLYEEPRYTVRESQCYAVGDGFPRIVESMLTPGVGGVRYNVSLAACQGFTVTGGQLEHELKGASGGA